MIRWAPAAESIALRAFIGNADCTLQILKVKGSTIPVLTPTDAKATEARPTPLAERAWVTCLWSAFAGYAIDEWTASLPEPRARWLGPPGRAAAGLLWALGPWPHAIQIGSWPLSTSLRDAHAEAELLAIVDAAALRYPTRPLAVRHVFSEADDAAKGSLLEALRARGFLSMPARVVYSLGANDARKPKASHLKRDLSLLAKGGLTRVDDDQFSDADLTSALALYQRIYRERHSRRNPDYNLAFLAWARSQGLIELLGLRAPDGRLVAFAARHNSAQTTSVPMLGYDLEADRRDGLYRQLVAQLVRDAGERNQRFDFSSGAGDFKRKRGFEPRLEYTLLRVPGGALRNRLQAQVLAWAARAAAGVNVERLIAAGA